jgi:MOSC domain-containing protein YiiM
MPIVHQISVSDGGVPKTPIDNAMIDDRGVVGDRQEDTVHHGSPDQALCLYSLEVIEGLQDEGHPIAAGSAGENLTVAGIDWSLVVPGVRLKVGSQVEIEITGYATPCSKNAQWFVDGDFTRMLQSRHQGESRLYARILTGGAVTTGAEVRLVG